MMSRILHFFAAGVAISASTITSTTVDSENLQAQLLSVLSSGAEVLLPGDSTFSNKSLRWNGYRAPTYRAYVSVATEQDVQNTVKLANEHNIPFLAVSGAHGWSTKLGDMESGIGIATKKLKKKEISEDGKTVRLGGGVESGEVEQFLTANGKRTTTGVCECTGMLGVALSGGHGILQGHYGLVADQIVEARVVLANGSAVAASATENSDLLWALKGAGQNFGIVTEYAAKIYDKPAEDNWSFSALFYTPDKIPAMYEALNTLMENQPAGMLLGSMFSVFPDVDPTTPLPFISVVFDGTAAELEPFLNPLLAIGPIFNQTSTIPYSAIPIALQFNYDSPMCEKGRRGPGYSLLQRKYDITAQVEVYKVFAEFLARYPSDAFTGSYIVFEAYAQQGVRGIESSSAAVAFRDVGIVVGAGIMYDKAEYDEVGREVGAKIRDLMVKGTGEELAVYVGYAYGDETPEQLYGRDEAKLRKLKQLKEKYDPEGRFGYYAPVV